MEIFGKHLFGSCKDEFMQLCRIEQKDWILKRTNQKDENLINEFLDNINPTKDDDCLNCEKHGHKRNSISKEVTAIVEPIDNRANGGENRPKRQPGVKKRKD